MIKEFKREKKKKRWCRINGRKYDMNDPEVDTNVYDYFNAVFKLRRNK